MHNRYSDVIKPVERLIENRRTVSDLIIQKVKRKGYSLDDKLPDLFAQEFALKAAEDFVKDLYKTKKLVANLD